MGSCINNFKLHSTLPTIIKGTTLLKMEKLRALNQTDNLYIKYCKKNDNEAVAGSTSRVLTRLQNKRTINRLRAELEQANLKCNAMSKSSYSYYLLLNKQLNVIDYSASYAMLVNNISHKTLQAGNNIADYIDGGLLIDVITSCERAIAGETFIVERQIVLSNKQSTWWMIECSPACNATNQIVGVVFNVVDITHRKTHELKIELQNRKLRQISLMQSHEIRGPLCTMMGLMDLIKIEGAINNNQYLELMDATMQQLDKSIRNIVDCASEER